MLYDIDRAAGATALPPVRRPARRAARGASLERATSGGRPRSTSARAMPIRGVAGDQQAALFGQGCWGAGEGQEHVRHGGVSALQRRDRCVRGAAVACSPPGVRRAGRPRVRPGGGDLHRRRRGAVAARWAGRGRDRGGDGGAGARRCARTTACTSCRRWWGWGRRTGSRARAGRSSDSRAAPRARTWRVRRWRRWRIARATCWRHAAAAWRRPSTGSAWTAAPRPTTG